MAPGKECSEKFVGVHRLVVLVISMSVRYFGKEVVFVPSKEHSGGKTATESAAAGCEVQHQRERLLECL